MDYLFTSGDNSLSYNLWSISLQVENPNKKSKHTTLGGQLGNYKGSQKDACVSVNSVKQGLKRQAHNFISTGLTKESRGYKVVCLSLFRLCFTSGDNSLLYNLWIISLQVEIIIYRKTYGLSHYKLR